MSELDRLVVQHQPQPQKTRKPLDRFERLVPLFEGTEPVVFAIPGFVLYGCDKCHKGDDLVDSAVVRMRQVVKSLQNENPSIQIPFRQYIIQPYADKWLHGEQLAHATFDTIRIFPHSVIIDSKVYGLATHKHETLHLAQSFLGRVNELEAYGLNVRSDPRFLVLNYPYFADVTGAFFVPEIELVLKSFFARAVAENLRVPREVQWYVLPFDSMDKLAEAIVKMSPLLDEVGRINRKQPVEAAYQSDRTGISSLILELAAVKLLPLPPLAVSDELRGRAFEILDLQMKKNDNTRLGYVIDRKKESMMTLQYQLALNDPAERLRLYFHYLRQRFILPDGKIDLKPADREDFLQYVRGKLDGVRKLLESEGVTPVELSAGTQWEERIKKELSANTESSR